MSQMHKICCNICYIQWDFSKKKIKKRKEEKLLYIVVWDFCASDRAVSGKEYTLLVAVLVLGILFWPIFESETICYYVSVALCSLLHCFGLTNFLCSLFFFYFFIFYYLVIDFWAFELVSLKCSTGLCFRLLFLLRFKLMIFKLHNFCERTSFPAQIVDLYNYVHVFLGTSIVHNVLRLPSLFPCNFSLDEMLLPAIYILHYLWRR